MNLDYKNKRYSGQEALGVIMEMDYPSFSESEDIFDGTSDFGEKSSIEGFDEENNNVGRTTSGK